MIRPLLAATAFSFAPATALAQMTHATCTQSLGIVAQSLQLEGPEELSVQDGHCIARGLTVLANRTRFEMPELRWELDGLEDLAHGGLLSYVRASAENVYIVPDIPYAGMQYAMRAQAVATGGIALEIEASSAGGHVDLTRFHLDFPGDNSIDLRTQIDGVNLSTPSDAMLRGVDLDVETNGLFESFALMPLASALLNNDSEIEPQVEMMRGFARGAVLALPASLMDETSREHAMAILEDLPNPAGQIHLTLDTGPGLPLTTLAAAGNSGERMLDALSDSTLELRYRRTQDE